MDNEPRITGIDFGADEGYSVVAYPDGVPCDHAGCERHISHPCEVCGRIGAKGTGYARVDSRKGF